MADAALLRDLPVTERGVRTRAALIAAAREVFERSGFVESRLMDITEQANLSAGTFYTYFSSKEEVFAAVLEASQEDMMHPGMPHVAADDDPVAIIEASNRAYLAAYQRNAKLMGLLEQVANIDLDFRRLRQNRGDAFVRRNARSIAELQERGLADPKIDPLLASRILSGMLGRLGYAHFVVEPSIDDGEQSATFEQLVYTATRLWANALRLPMCD